MVIELSNRLFFIEKQNNTRSIESRGRNFYAAASFPLFTAPWHRGDHHRLRDDSMNDLVFRRRRRCCRQKIASIHWIFHHSKSFVPRDSRHCSDTMCAHSCTYNANADSRDTVYYIVVAKLRTCDTTDVSLADFHCCNVFLLLLLLLLAPTATAVASLLSMKPLFV